MKGQVVVITGASSGIGRATARAFAAQGAAVVLAARREAALHQAADDVLRAGGRAMAVPTDVRDLNGMKRLAERTVDAFGGLDVWVNNAGMASFGKFDETPPEAFAAVVDTTFMGVVHGFYAALPHMKDQGHGHIITVASIAGRTPTPYHAAYGAAKHAVMGFIDSVRGELEEDGFEGIHLSSVLPGPVDTPFWQHAANYSGRAVQALQPAKPPEQVAETILRLARSPKREAGVGIPPWVLELGMALAGGAIERKMAGLTRNKLFDPRFRPRTAGSLLSPMAEFTGISGGWRERQQKSAGDRRRGPGKAAGLGLGGVLALAVPLGAAAYHRYQRHGKVF